MIRSPLSTNRSPSNAPNPMKRRGERMQAETLGLLCKAGSALSAYHVLGALGTTHPKIAPPTVYNGLAALTKAGRAHRVVSLKACIACQCEGGHQASVLSICDGCGHVEQHVAPRLVHKLLGFVKEARFRPERHVIEIHGMCSECGAGSNGA